MKLQVTLAETLIKLLNESISTNDSLSSRTIATTIANLIPSNGKKSERK
jgi:hypothetical protein